MAKAKSKGSDTNAPLGFDAKLAALRVTLRPELISGELRVKDAERVAQAAM